MENNDGRKLSRSAQDAIRSKAVKAVLEGWMTQTRAAEIFGVTRVTVCQWVNAFRKGGKKALESKSKGRPKGGKLSDKQEAAIRKSVLGRNPDQLRLPGLLWTRDLVAELIACRFGTGLSRWTVGRYLKKWGLSPQKPAKRALEQNPAQVRYWLRSNYPAIRLQAKSEKARIWWADETGLRSDHPAGTTWAKKGRTPVIRRSGKRFGCNMISAVTNKGEMCFKVFGERFTTKIFLSFLQRLAKQQAGRVTYVIVDRHSVHKAKKVAEWIAQQKGIIRLFFMPAYSPELNPDELVNQDIKRPLVTARRKTSPWADEQSSKFPAQPSATAVESQKIF